MSKKDRIIRVLSIVLLMTMLLFSFGCAGQESPLEINSSAISSDVSDVSEPERIFHRNRGNKHGNAKF